METGGPSKSTSAQCEKCEGPPDVALLRNASTRQQYYELSAKFLLQEGGKHWSCRHPGIVRELLWLWLYPSQKSVQFLQNTLAAQVSDCLQCAVALNTARMSAIDSTCEPDPAEQSSSGSGSGSGGYSAQPNALKNFIRKWDTSRLTQAFENVSGHEKCGEDSNRRLQGALCSHVEILLQPRLLLHHDHDGKRLNDAFAASMTALIQGDLRISSAQQLPGLYLLCVHSSSEIRSWARTQVLSRTALLEHGALFLELHEVLDILVNHSERLTMIRNGCDDNDEQEGLLPLPIALSNDEREVWTGLTIVIRHFAPCIVRDHLLPRYGGLVPLALMSITENSAAALPSAQCLHYLMRCLGRAFWQDSVCSFSPATLKRVLENLAMNPLALVPVRQTCLELLEELLMSASQHALMAQSASGDKSDGSAMLSSLTDEVLSFLSSRKLRSGAHAHVAVSATATRVLTRVLQRLLARGGLAELPIASCHDWTPHVVGTACSPNLPEPSRAPPALLLARIVSMQTASIEAALLNRTCAAETSEQQVIAGEFKGNDTTKPAGLAQGMEQAQEQHDARDSLSNSCMWLEDVWCWLLQRAGVENIPEQVHVVLLKAACTLLIWPCESQDPKDSRCTAILRRFKTLISGYLESLASIAELASTLAQRPEVERVFFELALIQKPGVRESLREFIYRALGMGHELSNGQGVVHALEAMACRSPAALAAGMRSAFEHAKLMGLDGDAFAHVHYLFLLAGQVMPRVIGPLLKETRHALLQSAWDVMQAFIDCRARLRTGGAIKRHGNVALDAIASSFFVCFRTLWPHFATLVATAYAPCDAQAAGLCHLEPQTLAETHALWLPAIGKWGGIASAVVRRHWCSCMLDILCTLRESHMALTPKERAVIDKLIARRDLWTDEQYLALCTQVRPLGAKSVRGNLGMGALADLPSAPRAPKGATRGAVVDLTRDSVESDVGKKRGGEEKDAQKSHARTRTAKRNKPDRLEAESLSSCSEDAESSGASAKATQKKVRKHEVGGLMSILADMGCNGKHTGPQSQSAGALTLTVGGHVVHVLGTEVGNDVPLDALGRRTRRQARSAEELQHDFLAQILWWDLRLSHRQGPPCSKVPVSFESLDQYEDVLGLLLLEETWEQIASAYGEERGDVEDQTADFGAMRVLTYDEFGDFVHASVCPNPDRGKSAGGDSGALASGFNEMDLVLLVSPDPFADAHGSLRGATQASKMEHLLALVESAQRGDAEAGIVRLKILSRRTPRCKRFSERFARASTRNGFAGERASSASLEAASMPKSDQYIQDPYHCGGDSHPRLRMMCLNYSVSTSMREYVALHRLRSLDARTQRAVLAPGVTCAAPPGGCKGNVGVLPREALNVDQIQAITSCLEPGPVFSLIQGPPGTGKTSTLVSLVTALLAGPSGQVQAGARVLVCAPSNAAVDELAKRFSLGLATHGSAQRYRPSVVRIGAKHQMRRDVWDSVGLEGQVLRRLAQIQGQQQSSAAELNMLKAELESLTERLEQCEQAAQGAGHDDEGEVSPDMQALQSARKHALALCAQKAALAGVSESRTAVLKRQLRSQILDNAQIVCTTLSGAGTALMQSSKRSFIAVIVDEAAQALEPSVLIPLQLNVDRCILVGDPQQLPATVTSRTADANMYARSLFERLQAAGHSASLLSVQYRMHPSIRAFPSNHFYAGKLSDSLGEHGRRAPWHADSRFAPLVFYDIKGDQDVSHGSTSRSNNAEAKACVSLLLALQHLMPRGIEEMQQRVAIMSPYRRQCSEIRRRLNGSGLGDIEVSSVDAFQGREIDVALVSCVRSGHGGLGFVADIRRLNVAITRARCSLLILGNAATLSQSEHWAALISHARSTGSYISLEKTDISKMRKKKENGE